MIAAFDNRQGTNADLPNVIDVLCSRSTDGGVTWSATATLAAHTAGATQSTAAGRGDPCLTTNTVTGRVFCHYIFSPPGVSLASSDNTTTTTSTTTLHAVYRFSDDQGATWSAEVDITPSVKTSAMLGTSASSGHGFCDSSGTVYVPYCYTDSGGARHDFVMLSSDNGATWSRSSILNSAVDEHHVTQRSDGSWLSNGRPVSTTARQLYVSSTMAGTWTLLNGTALPDPKCNGDILRVDPSNTSARAGWLLASGCASTASRANLTVWLSKDNGASWTSAWQVYPGAAAYSSLVRLPDGTFGIFWEDSDNSGMLFTKFSLAALAP